MGKRGGRGGHGLAYGSGNKLLQEGANGKRQSEADYKISDELGFRSVGGKKHVQIGESDIHKLTDALLACSLIIIQIAIYTLGMMDRDSNSNHCNWHFPPTLRTSVI